MSWADDRVTVSIVSYRRLAPASPPLDALAEDDRARRSRARRWGETGSSALARLRGGSLDRALAAGADPARSRALAARAAQLTSPNARLRLAESLEQLLRRAREPSRPGRVTPQRRTVLAEQSDLQELADRLRGPELVYAQGVAMLRLLLTDGAGPVFARRPEGSLHALACAAHAAMRGNGALST